MNRRTVLRGIGGIITLPFLESLAPRPARAAAAGAVPPTRLAFLFMPNGVHPHRWTPEGEGLDWKSSPLLQPLAAHRQDLTILTSLQNALLDQSLETIRALEKRIEADIARVASGENPDLSVKPEVDKLRDRLKSMKEGAGNVPDHSMILFGRTITALPIHTGKYQQTRVLERRLPGCQRLFWFWEHRSNNSPHARGFAILTLLCDTGRVLRVFPPGNPLRCRYSIYLMCSVRDFSCSGAD